MVATLIWIFFLLTILYFFIGLGSYFLGNDRTIKYGLFSLALLVILVVLYIIFNDTGKENLASAIALGLFFWVLPLATFTIGVLISIVIKYLRKRNESQF
jgi:hypothetical protein